MNRFAAASIAVLAVATAALGLTLLACGPGTPASNSKAAANAPTKGGGTSPSQSQSPAPGLAPIASAKRELDVANLKGLVERFVAGQAQGLKRPRSKGRDFWIAMVVGDGTSDGYKPGTMGAYMSPRDAASLLISPFDPNAMEKDAVAAVLEQALTDGVGVAGLKDRERLCSYAGPVNGGSTMMASGGVIVGCTGLRNGASIDRDGLSYVRSNGEAGHISFEQATKPTNQGGWGWTAGTNKPLYGVAPLNVVAE